MRVRAAYRLPPERERALRRAIRLEWWSLSFGVTAVAAVGLTMGSSQTMKAAWVENLLMLVPPMAFLVATRFAGRPPDERFPYGYRRAHEISFLIAAVTLFGVGSWILVDSILGLVSRTHPSIGVVDLFGWRPWAGWLMIAALAYSLVPPVLLGRAKLRIARELHDKTLHADAKMDKASWLGAGAGILGVLGIGLGWWWADATAAVVISFDTVRDGAINLKQVALDLMDHRPVTVDRRRRDRVGERIVEAVERLPWVAEATVRLREEGEVLNGELFVVPAADRNLTSRCEQARRVAEQVDWRLHDLVVTPVRRLDVLGERPGPRRRTRRSDR